MDSHLQMDQNTTAVNNKDIEYTSPSTAENQTVSKKVPVNPAINPAANIK